MITSPHPITIIFYEIQLEVFGCTALVHAHNKGKSNPKVQKCVFVGYTPTQNGYKCYNGISKRMHITMEVTFFYSKVIF